MVTRPTEADRFYLGELCGNGGSFSLWIYLLPDGTGRLYMQMAKGGGKVANILSRLDESSLDELAAMLDKARATIAELKALKRLDHFTLGD